MLMIASQLSPAVSTVFQQPLGSVAFLPVEEGLEAVPAGVQILLAGSKWGAGSTPPLGWPFDLEWVHLPSSGLDLYPDWLFDGPIVTNSPGIYGISIAEYAMTAILAAAKRLPDLWIREPGQWRPTTVKAVAGSVLGIVGFGDIGQALASRALAFGMEVQALRRSSNGFPAGIRAAGSLNELFATSDHVVLAAPATPQTAKMISSDVLGAAKPGLHLINVARGSLIDDDALLAALEAGIVARATLDVTDPEPLPAGHPFYNHPHIKLTPHTACNSTGLVQQLVACFGENVHRFRNGEQLANVVNWGRSGIRNYSVGRV